MGPTTKHPGWFGIPRITVTACERDYHAIWQLPVKVPDSLPDRILGCHLHLSNVFRPDVSESDGFCKPRL